jgi:putative hemolysin
MLETTIIKIVLFIVCVALSAFFSSAEVALISINRAKVRTLVNEGRKGAEALATLKEKPEHILTTILVGNNIVNIGAAAIATSIAIEVFGDIGVGIATGVVTVLLLVFGEIGPKIYATRAADSYALRISGPILLLTRLLSPVSWLVDRVSGRIGQGAALSEPVVTEEEIKVDRCRKSRRNDREGGTGDAVQRVRVRGHHSEGDNDSPGRRRGPRGHGIAR